MLFTRGEKLTSNIAKAVRYRKGRKEVKEFLLMEKSLDRVTVQGGGLVLARCNNGEQSIHV